jgi:HEPN domain-containing protein
MPLLDEDEYERWFRQADHTLRSAEHDLKQGDFVWASFKAHQAAEYAVKAALRALGLEAYGPSVSALLARLEGSEPLLEEAKRLDRHYLAPRYPNQWSEGTPLDYYTRRDAEEAINTARRVLNWVSGCVGRLRRG